MSLQAIMGNSHRSKAGGLQPRMLQLHCGSRAEVGTCKSRVVREMMTMSLVGWVVGAGKVRPSEKVMFPINVVADKLSFADF